MNFSLIGPPGWPLIWPILTWIVLDLCGGKAQKRTRVQAWSGVSTEIGALGRRENLSGLIAAGLAIGIE